LRSGNRPWRPVNPNSVALRKLLISITNYGVLSAWICSKTDSIIAEIFQAKSIERTKGNSAMAAGLGNLGIQRILYFLTRPSIFLRERAKISSNSLNYVISFYQDNLKITKLVYGRFFVFIWFIFWEQIMN
jgi:hypothetical protein